MGKNNCSEAAARSLVFDAESDKHGFDDATARLNAATGDGTNIGSYTHALTKLGIHSAKTWNPPNDDRLKRFLQNAHPDSPAIAHVGWTGGGGHFVIVKGTLGANLLVLDPYYGLQEVPLATFPAYNPSPSANRQAIDGNSAQGAGSFSRWIVTTN